jgi:hypothetical protein
LQAGGGGWARFPPSAAGAIIRHPALLEGVAMSKFEVYRDRAGKYRWRLRAANSEIIAGSEGYSSKAACLGGIAAVKREAGKAKIVQV